jgi:predicted metal-dependent hydrolase
MVARDVRGVRQPATHRGDRLTEERTNPERATVSQSGRLKAYRPIPPDLRRAALEAGLSAYERGDFFKAHELLEPAWMGTSDLAERALYQGLIKLAAGYVHAVRGNPIGLSRNLTGARAHLETSQRLDAEVSRGAGIDLAALLVRIDARLAAVGSIVAEPAAARGPLIDLVPEAPQVR